MFTIDEFGNFNAAKQEEIVNVFIDGDGEDGPVLPLSEEEAIYNMAGVMATDLRESFNLRKVNKRDVALYIAACGRNPSEVPSRLLDRVAKYIKGYFAMSMQGPLELSNDLF